MTIEANTSLVHHFGDSIVFGNSTGGLGQLFQPFLFYPDWFFVSWPSHMFLECFYGQHLNGEGGIALVTSMLWLVIGFFLGHYEPCNDFADFKTIKRHPISDKTITKCHNHGILGELIALPLLVLNGIYHFLYKTFWYLLFWHVTIAAIITWAVTFNGHIGYQLTRLIRSLVLFCMLAPPIVYIAYSIIKVITVMLTQPLA